MAWMALGMLHNKGKRTEGTRSAVLKVVKEYDFQLNCDAVSLAMLRSSNTQD